MRTLKELQRSRGLQVRCPTCDAVFPVQRASLFDATRTLPDFAEEYLAASRAELIEERRDLRTRRAELKRRSSTGAEASGVGQMLEMVAASLPGLPVNSADCRALFKPIDYIAFEGAARGKVESIRFIEVKTGGQRLSAVQRSIRTAIEHGRVRLRVADHSLPDPELAR